MITKNWKIISACVMLVVLIYFMVFHWNRFLTDFWPIDHSNVGPNLVASVVQYALLAILVVLLYPPARRAVERFTIRHVNSIKEHISVEHDAIHEKIDHFIKHSTVPDFVPTVSRPTRPSEAEQATPQ